MKWRPMIFTAESVLDFLAHQKTQTRRVLYLKRIVLEDTIADGKWYGVRLGNGAYVKELPGVFLARAPHHVGDAIWVKEALWRDSREADSDFEAVIYQATPELWRKKNEPNVVKRCEFPTTPRDGHRANARAEQEQS